LADQTQTTHPETTADHLAAELLANALAASPAEVFHAGAGIPVDEAARLQLAKSGADLLVKSRLARFPDEGRTTLELTNAGRYWAMHGGWMAFLKEPPQESGGRGRNSETEALRTEFMKLRLRTFWWTFGLSVAGFIISIISMTIAIMYGARMFG
jgi:hypothetical protein